MIFKVFDLVVHLKTGNEYSIRGLPKDYFIESTGEPAYVYVDPITKKHWVRGQNEMEDGRFVIKKHPDHIEDINKFLNDIKNSNERSVRHIVIEEQPLP